jgi:signal recognition particle subunit SRP72
MAEHRADYLRLIATAITHREHDDIVTIAGQLLEAVPNDDKGYWCRAIACLKTNQWAQALSDLQQLKKVNLDFERCLALYGQERYTEAAQFINSLPPAVQSEERWACLREQLYFRLEDAEKLRSIFNDSYLNTLRRADDPDRLVNAAACLFITRDYDRLLSLLGPSPTTAQIANAATALYHAHDFPKVLELVERGERNEAGSAKPKLIPLWTLSILRSTILADSDPQTAADQFNALVDYPNINPRVRAIAASNYAALTLESNAHLARQRLALFEKSAFDTHFSKSAKEAFLVNRFLILHKIGQQGKTKQLIEAAKQESVNALLVEALERTLDPGLKPTSENSSLFIAQGLIAQSKFEDAARFLAQSALVRHPRTIAVIVELFVAAGKVPDAIAFLQSVQSTRREFFEYAALFAYRNGFIEEAWRWAEKLTDRSQRSAAVQALILCESDVEMAEDRMARFQVPKVSEEEIDALEATIKPVEAKEEVTAENVFGVEPVKKRVRISSQMTPEKIKKIKEKKRKRRRLQKPKNYDPQRKMDPERWLPLSKRTGGKHKGKKPQKAGSPGASGGKQGKTRKGRTK